MKKLAVEAATSKSRPVTGLKSDQNVVHHMQSLLHTMRCIEQHEEQLCTLMHAIRTGGMVEETTAQVLRSLLDDLPAQAYESDLNRLFAALDAQASPVKVGLNTGKRRRRSPASKQDSSNGRKEP